MISSLFTEEERANTHVPYAQKTIAISSTPFLKKSIAERSSQFKPVYPDTQEIIKRIRTLKDTDHRIFNQHKHSLNSLVVHDKKQIFYEDTIELIKKVTMMMG